MKKQHIPVYPAVVRKKWSFLLYKAGWTAERICKEYGISRKTLYKWIKKDRELPIYEALKLQPALKLTPQIRIFLEEQKKLSNAGPKKLAIMVEKEFGVKVSSTIVYRFLKKKGLIKNPQKKLPWYTPMKEKIIPKAPGDLVELDIKHVYKEGKLKYQRTFLDVYTRMQYVHLSRSRDSNTTINALKEAIEFFPFNIKAIQTDNGSEFRGKFHTYLEENNIKHYFIPKSSPQWNGCVERVNRSIDEEFYLNIFTPYNNIHEYIHWYSTKRPHLGKGMDGLTPMEKFLQWGGSVTHRC